MGRKLGAVTPFSQFGQSRGIYLHTKWRLDPSSRLGTIDMGQKLGAVPPFWGGGAGSPSSTMWPGRLGRGLHPYQVAPWSIEPFGHNIYGPKLGGCAPLGEEELGPHLTQCGQEEAYLHAKFHLDTSNRLATVQERHRQDRQDRTDRQATVR